MQVASWSDEQSILVTIIIAMQLTAEQHKKRIQTDQVIKFRNREQPSSQKHRPEEESENSNVHLQDESMLKNIKKNLPLPELNREKRKLKMYDPKPTTTPVYLEKEVALRDNLILKNTNNALLTENKKMKTRLANLQREVQRLEKAPEGSQRISESVSVRTLIKNLKKELEESKRQMARLKTSTKFTSIKELQVENEKIMEETQRLRQMLEAEQQQTAILRKNQNQHLQTEVKRLQEKCGQLEREEKMRKTRSAKSSLLRVQAKAPLPDGDVIKQLESARRIIKSKEEEIAFLKKEIKKNSNTMVISDFSEKNIKLGDRLKPQTPNLRINTKRQMKSAPKNRHNLSSDLEQCSACKRMKEESDGLKLQIEDMKEELQRLRAERPSLIEDLITHPIKKPTPEEAEQLRRFILYRLKAHGIGLEEAASYLLNVKSFAPSIMSEGVSLVEIFETASLQPFSLIVDRYIEAFLCIVFVGEEQLQAGSLKLQSGMKRTKQEVKQSFQRFIGPFPLESKEQEEKLFIEISQIVTSRAQEISKVLALEKNAQDTISEERFRAVFERLGVAENLISFMISQIILESLSLQFLKVDNLFDIFYLVEQELPEERVERAEIAPIKEEEAEDEESRSFFEPKKQSYLQKEEQQPSSAAENAQNPLPQQEQYEGDNFQQEQEGQDQSEKQKQMPQKQAEALASQKKEVLIQNIDENYEDYFDS